MKKLSFFIGFVFIISISLAACSSSTSSSAPEETDGKSESEQSDDIIDIKVGHIAPDDHSYTKGIEAFAEAVEEESDGRVRFEIFGNGQLGGEREIIEQVQLGSLDMTVATGGVLGSFVPEMSVLEMPFLFNDVEHAYQALDGDIGEELMQKIDEAGFKTLGIWENGMRHIINNKHPVHSPDDMKDLKIRTVENDLYLETYQALGADPTPIAFPEVYTSLQQGVIDGQDNSYGVMVTTKMYEVQNHLTENMVYYASAPVLMNVDTFNALPEDIQEIFVNAGREFTDVQREINQNMEAEQIEFLKEEGVEIVVPTEEEMEAFRTAVEPVYDKLSDQFGDMVERIRTIGN